MKQQLLSNDEVAITPSLKKPYNKGAYNKFNDKEQWIRISEGCPNKCPFCRESFENGTEPIYYPIPEIVRNQVKIIDMNLTAKPKVVEILNDLGSRHVNEKVIRYELVCGVDYRFLTQQIANALKRNRFSNIRLAWDGVFSLQDRIKTAVKMLNRAGFRSNSIMVFMICNWKVTYEENCRKLDLCKVWNVKVGDCYFDNQLSPNVRPIFWAPEQITNFRRKVRKHNQLVLFGIDPQPSIVAVKE